MYDSGTAIGTLFRTHIRVIPASLVASQSTKHSFCSVQQGTKKNKIDRHLDGFRVNVANRTPA